MKDREITLILHIEKSVMRGKIRTDKTGEWRTVSIDGEKKVRWNQQVLRTIVDNYQIDSGDVFSALIFSDRQLNQNAVPSDLKLADKWTISQVGQIVREEQIKAAKWVLNGQTFENQEILPIRSGEKDTYIWSIPECHIPEQTFNESSTMGLFVELYEKDHTPKKAEENGNPEVDGRELIADMFVPEEVKKERDFGEECERDWRKELNPSGHGDA